MKIIMPICVEHDVEPSLIGNKGVRFATLLRMGMPIPETWCISSRIYNYYLEKTGLCDKLPVILNRKRFEDMRWEEVWDLSLRIRNLFIRTHLPPEINQPLVHEISEIFKSTPVSIRSSAVTDSMGIQTISDVHDSYLAVTGTEQIIKYIRLVWASLWSYEAILLNQELGLSVDRSRMAVLIQPTVMADVSGFISTRQIADDDQIIIEAVHGQNYLLANERIEPDRWAVCRSTGLIEHHEIGSRNRWVSITQDGLRIDDLPADLQCRTPLNDEDLKHLAELGIRIESQFSKTKSIEWVHHRGVLSILNIRSVPESSGAHQIAGVSNHRTWQLNLSRSHEDLKSLRKTLEVDSFPQIQHEIDQVSDQQLSDMSDSDLVAEVFRRRRVFDNRRSMYWSRFVPLIHGIRLFGREYNERMEPADPFEFLLLLTGTPMISLQRNDALLRIARSIGETSHTAESLQMDVNQSDEIRVISEKITQTAGHLSALLSTASTRLALYHLLRQLSDGDTLSAHLADNSAARRALEIRFLDSFPENEKNMARELLDLARASYRLRDDDNIHLGKIESAYRRALHEVTSRLADRGVLDIEGATDSDIMKILPDSLLGAPQIPAPDSDVPSVCVRMRQMYGQPASPGISKGTARVIRTDDDLFSFQRGEIMVCDSIDPNMTFVAPLCRGIVERRGGMLVHGAIIAREYGIPCITGIPDATKCISTGDSLSIDGHLGLIIVTTS